MPNPEPRTIAHAVLADLLAQYLSQTAGTPTPDSPEDIAVADELRAIQRRYARSGASARAVAHPVKLSLLLDSNGEPRWRDAPPAATRAALSED